MDFYERTKALEEALAVLMADDIELKYREYEKSHKAVQLRI